MEIIGAARLTPPVTLQATEAEETPERDGTAKKEAAVNHRTESAAKKEAAATRANAGKIEGQMGVAMIITDLIRDAETKTREAKGKTQGVMIKGGTTAELIKGVSAATPETAGVARVKDAASRVSEAETKGVAPSTKDAGATPKGGVPRNDRMLVRAATATKAKGSPRGVKGLANVEAAPRSTQLKPKQNHSTANMTTGRIRPANKWGQKTKKRPTSGRQDENKE